MGLKRNFAKCFKRRKALKYFLNSDKSPENNGDAFKAGFNVGWKQCTKWLMRKENKMEKEKILEGVEEALQKAFELEMDCIISFDRCVYTKNKKYYLSTTLKPIDKENEE